MDIFRTYRKIEKYLFNIVPPRVPRNPFAYECIVILYIIYVNGVLGLGGGGEQYPTAKNVISVLEPKYVKVFLT